MLTIQILFLQLAASLFLPLLTLAASIPPPRALRSQSVCEPHQIGLATQGSSAYFKPVMVDPKCNIVSIGSISGSGAVSFPSTNPLKASCVWQDGESLVCETTFFTCQHTRTPRNTTTTDTHSDSDSDADLCQEGVDVEFCCTENIPPPSFVDQTQRHLV